VIVMKEDLGDCKSPII